MRRTPVMLSIVLLFLSRAAAAEDPIAKSVVKVHSIIRQPDYVRPWNKGNAQEASGSGFILDGRRILTNAHVVNYASQIFVQAHETTDRVPAKVAAVAPMMDMAILEVDNPAFFSGRAPLKLADGVPSLKQTVAVYGYPMGGEEISITQGIVSRIECAAINGLVSGLRIQIDAAINPGNSGGPVIVDGKVTGMVFSKITRGENIGYLLAGDEVRQFLAAIQHGVYGGKPVFWGYTQPTENESLRAKLGLAKETGVLFVRPLGAGPDFPLRKWDVLLSLGGQSLDNQGNVKIKDDLRVSYEYLVPKLAQQGRVKATIFRDKKKLDLEIPVAPEGNFVVPFVMDKYPRYFIYGPMVFMTGNQTLAAVLRRTGETGSPLVERQFDPPAFPGEEIVILGARLLTHKTAKGYKPTPFSVVTHVNGTAVRNLIHLVELLRDARSEFLTIDLSGYTSPLVFRRSETADATEEILADEGVRKQYSADLEKVWHAAKK